VITELAVGEALVSTLDAKGVPSPVARTMIRPPCSRLGPISADEREAVVIESPIGVAYNESIDRKSAYEILEKEMARAQREADKQARREAKAKGLPPPKRPRTRRRQSYGEAAAKSAIRTASSSITREFIRGILGSLRKRLDGR
jgi:hypothetical protein